MKYKEIWLNNSLCDSVYKQKAIEKWTKGCILPFLQKGNLGITKDYRSIILTAIAAKVYNAQLLNCIWCEVEKILRKIQDNSLQVIYRGKMEQILVTYGLPKETITIIMTRLQKHENYGLLSPWWHWLLWHCRWNNWSLSRRYATPYLLIIFLDYVLQLPSDLIKEYGFILK